MATIPTPVGVTDGVVAHDTTLNVGLLNIPTFLYARPYCQLWMNATVSLTSGTLVLIPWDTEAEDNDNMHSTITNPSRIICQTPGLYTITVSAGITSSATGGRFIMLRLNSAGSSGGGTQIATLAVPATAAGGANINGQVTLKYRFVNVGDYIEIFFEQNSAGTLTTVGGAQYSTNVTAIWEIQ